MISALSLFGITLAFISDPDPQQIIPENIGEVSIDLPAQNQTLPDPVQPREQEQAQNFIGRLLVIPETSYEIGGKGWSGALRVELRSILGFEGETSLTLVNLPAEVKAEFTPQTLSIAQGSSEVVILHITIQETAESGTYPVTIETHSGEETWGAELELEVVDHLVEMKGSAFVAGNITISKGATVVWVNRDTPERFDDLRHDVISPDGGFSSPLLGTGEIFRYTFENAGRFLYSCEPHPWMVGQIQVSG